MVYHAFTFNRKRKKKERKKEKENDIRLNWSQVMLYVDQWDHVKHKFDDHNSNWLDVFFNLTKDMIESLLSDQFQNIELDSKSYCLEN